MINNRKPAIFTLLLLISIANVAGLLFSPGLPALRAAFQLTTNQAQLTITLYLIGYALGQLPYGPLANRFGRKKAIYFGLGSAIVFCIVSWFAACQHMFYLLLTARFLTALGASVGLMITLTIVAEAYEKTQAAKVLSYLMASFAIMPGLATTVGGLIVDHFNWQLTFLMTAVYLAFVLTLCFWLPETLKQPKTLHIKHIYHGYVKQLSHFRLITCGILMGSATAFVYVFASLAPFITINYMHLSATKFGLLNLLPQAGVLIGAIFSGKIKRSAINKIFLGIGLLTCGVLIIFVSALAGILNWENLFFPMGLNLIGTTLIYSNAAVLGTLHSEDKSNASSVMSFINMAIACIAVLLSNVLKTHLQIALSMAFLALLMIIIIMAVLVKDQLINEEQVQLNSSH